MDHAAASRTRSAAAISPAGYGSLRLSQWRGRPNDLGEEPPWETHETDRSSPVWWRWSASPSSWACSPAWPRSSGPASSASAARATRRRASRASEQSLYLPDPVPTEEEGGPLVTLAGTPSQQAEEEEPSEEPSVEKPKKPINLAAGATAVSGEEQLYLSGTYPGGEGSILDIEYKINDQPWREFNLDVNVSGQTFATYVYTSNAGTIKWRMWDKSRNKRSNAVTVKHG